MKKTIAFIPTLVLALSCFTAFAESSVEYKNVVYRGRFSVSHLS